MWSQQNRGAPEELFQLLPVKLLLDIAALVPIPGERPMHRIFSTVASTSSSAGVIPTTARAAARADGSPGGNRLVRGNKNTQNKTN